MTKSPSPKRKMFGNSKDGGEITFFLYHDEKEDAWVGVCLQMDIVKVGSNLDKVKNELEEATLSVIRLVKDGKLSEKVLNKPAPHEYWERLVGIGTPPTSKTKKAPMRASVEVTTTQDVFSRAACPA